MLKNSTKSFHFKEIHEEEKERWVKPTEGTGGGEGGDGKGRQERKKDKWEERRSKLA